MVTRVCVSVCLTTPILGPRPLLRVRVRVRVKVRDRVRVMVRVRVRVSGHVTQG